MDEQENPNKAEIYQLGQDLSEMSVGELKDTVALLKSEIVRLQEAASSKSEHLNAAEALFKS